MTPPPPARDPLLWGLVLSVGVHLVGAAWMPAERAAARADARVREVEFTVSLPRPAAPDPPAVPPRRTPRDRAAPPPAPEPRAAAEVAVGGATAPGPTPAEPAPPTLEPPPEDDEEARRRARRLDLSPSAVARAGLRLELPGGPRDPGAYARTEAPGRDAAFYAERGASMGEGLAREANRRPTGRRPAPRLRRSTDGGLHWEGPLVSARIAPDGSVEFTDMPGVSVGLGEGGGSALGGRFDLNDAIERGQGRDPRGAEKRWFLAETQTLRDGMAAEAHQARLGVEERRLLGRLRAIWGDLEASPEARRLRIFRLWDQLAEDEVGDRARGVVERFVRETLPAGSAECFGGAELAELNARRASRDRFAPYR